ncbi:MAG: TIGR03000 domain-containing protein [Gemmataceae bacterium]
MKTWFAAIGTIAALAYFGCVPETEARLLRRRPTVCSPNACVPCPPPTCDPCLPTKVWPLAYGHASATPPAAAEPPTPPAAAPSAPSAAAPTTAPVEPVPTPAVPPATPAPGTKLYVLLIADETAKDGGEANKAGATLMERLVRQGLPKDRIGAVIRIAAADATQEKIRDRLATLPIRPDDSILCYYSGPATYDDASKSYTLTPDGAKLPRSELRAELQLHKPGLIVLLTDTPSNAVQPANVPPLPYPASIASLQKLLLDAKGLIDLNASASSELAFPRGNEGGLFTLALVQDLAKGPAAWPSLVTAASTNLDRLYKQYRGVVLMSDNVPADEKRAYREQATQTLTPLSPIDPGPATPAIPEAPSLAPINGDTIRTIDALPRPAEIVVRLPAGARLLIDGEPTKQTSTERRFETPDLKSGKVYYYSLRAEFEKDGKPAIREQRVEIRAGDEKIIVIE